MFSTWNTCAITLNQFLLYSKLISENYCFKLLTEKNSQENNTIVSFVPKFCFAQLNAQNKVQRG